MKKLMISLVIFAFSICHASEVSAEGIQKAASESESETVIEQVQNAESTANPEQTFLISKVTCWEVLTLDESDTAYGFTLIYGYAAGKKKQSIQSASDIEKIITATVASCSNNVEMPAYDAMLKNWGAK